MTDEQLREWVKDLLRSNVSQGYSRLLKTDYCYTKPSPGTYTFQWWWDTCFEAFMLCALGEYDLAKRTLNSLFAMQEADGFVGHMIFWKSRLPRNPLNVLRPGHGFCCCVPPARPALCIKGTVRPSWYAEYALEHGLNALLLKPCLSPRGRGCRANF